jgi:Ca2+-binding EF-hand superfamily protein
MLTPKFLAASVIALGLASGDAIGQDATRRDADTRLVQLDADRNGGVTRAELAMIPDLAQRFEKFDANKDGKLDRAEFAALIASMK